jgi:phosphate transport system protein
MAPENPETRKTFSGELSELRDLVLQMGTFVEDMLSRAMQSLVTQDVDLASEVRRSDDIADTFDLQIEGCCTRLLALQQPLARDLRAVIAAVRMSSDLERIGDYAKDIAKVTLRLAGIPYYKPLEDLPRMARLAGDMIRMAIRCFVDRDLETARRVAEMDKTLDDLWAHLRDELIAAMGRDASLVMQATHLLLVARYLERIGDHTVNVVERVVYQETGKIGHLI